jgi:hypothetical protein
MDDSLADYTRGASRVERGMIDTQAGGIAEAFYGVPEEIAAAIRERLPEDLLTVVDAFYRSFR